MLTRPEASATDGSSSRPMLFMQSPSKVWFGGYSVSSTMGGSSPRVISMSGLVLGPRKAPLSSSRTVQPDDSDHRDVGHWLYVRLIVVHSSAIKPEVPSSKSALRAHSCPFVDKPTPLPKTPPPLPGTPPASPGLGSGRSFRLPLAGRWRRAFSKSSPHSRGDDGVLAAPYQQGWGVDAAQVVGQAGVVQVGTPAQAGGHLLVGMGHQLLLGGGRPLVVFPVGHLGDVMEALGHPGLGPRP